MNVVPFHSNYIRIKNHVHCSNQLMPRYVRINTLVKSVEDSICSFTEEGWTLLPKSQKYSTFLKTLASLGEETFIQDFHIPELFAFPPGTHFHDHPGYQCGAIVLQDKASCLPSYFLNPTPGSTVLDMCSAPGMKTTHLAAIMKNTGKILAVERHNRRYKTLCEMIKTYTADCVETINTDAMTLDPKLYSNIEYILVDPSCSGSGMLDRISLGKADSKCAPGRLMSLQSFQVLLLRHALLNFPMVKRVVYSTCSMYPEENEMVIDEILEDIDGSYDLVPIRKLIGPEWKNFSSMDYKCKDRCLYAKPDVDMCNGFFVAVFERNFDVPLPEYKRKDAVKRGKNNDQLKSEEGKDDVGSQLERKKNLKRRQSNGASDNGSKIAKVEGELEVEFDENETQDEVEPPKKEKKKKRREAKWEIIDISQHVEVKSELPVDKKKKKKKKKQGDVETLEEEMNGTSETLQVEEPKIKKKKKTKRSEVKILEEIIPTTTISDDEKSKKKKKKKKDNTET